MDLDVITRTEKTDKKQTPSQPSEWPVRHLSARMYSVAGRILLVAG
jgi:hypothetical protein